MSYYVADQRGYLDDVASVSGMGAFRTWAMHQGGVIHDFASKGVCHDPQALTDALAAVHSDDPAVDDVREGLMACAARADGIVIVSDGVGSDDEDDASSANEDDEKLFEGLATTPASDVKAFSALAKEAYAHQEPELRNALIGAWKGAAHGFSMTECRAGVREKDYAKLAKLLVKANTRIRSVVEPRVSAQYLRGVQLGARPLARNGVVLRAPLRISMSTMNPKAAAWARARAGTLVADDARAKDLIKDFVTMGAEDGFNVDEVAKLIKDIIGLDYRRALSIERYAAELVQQGIAAELAEKRVAEYVDESLLSRATTISRTEIIMAQSAGQQGLWEEAVKQGMLTGLRRIWIVAEDCCDECDDIATATMEDPIGIDDEFEDGVKFPPLHPNCRCTMGLVKVKDE